MLLNYFTEEAYEKLLHEIKDNADKYFNEDEWLDDYFSNRNDYYQTSKSVDVNRFVPAYTHGNKTDEQKSQDDLINVRMIYDAYKNLTPLQASNKYMWTYLCHAVPEFRKYIRDRWMAEARENTIKTRFFVTDSGSLFDNALSRLWWYGHLTYDVNNSNHYALTEILLINQTICTDVIDTLNRMNFNRIKGVLLAIRDFKELLKEKEGITEYFRKCKKYLNHYAAVTTLDFLEAEEIQKLAFDYMVNLREKKLSI